MTLSDLKASINIYLNKQAEKHHPIYYRDSAGNRVRITDPPVSRRIYKNLSIPLESMPDKSYELRLEKMMPEDRIRALDIVIANMINYYSEPDIALTEGQTDDYLKVASDTRLSKEQKEDFEIFTKKARSRANEAEHYLKKGDPIESVASLFEKLFHYSLLCYESFREEKRFNAQANYNRLYQRNVNQDVDI